MVAKCHLLDLTGPLQSLTHNNCVYWHQACTRLVLSVISYQRGGAYGFLPFLLIYWLQKDSRRNITIFRCAPKGEPTKLQRLAPTHGHTNSLIKFSGSQKKTKRHECGKVIGKKKRTNRCGGGSNYNTLYRHMKMSRNKFN